MERSALLTLEGGGGCDLTALVSEQKKLECWTTLFALCEPANINTTNFDCKRG
jgi:hypothetical protein